LNWVAFGFSMIRGILASRLTAVCTV
jgi:hypothetical protein